MVTTCCSLYHCTHPPPPPPQAAPSRSHHYTTTWPPTLRRALLHLLLVPSHTARPTAPSTPTVPSSLLPSAASRRGGRAGVVRAVYAPWQAGELARHYAGRRTGAHTHTLNERGARPLPPGPHRRLPQPRPPGHNTGPTPPTLNSAPPLTARPTPPVPSSTATTLPPDLPCTIFSDSLMPCPDECIA